MTDHLVALAAAAGLAALAFAAARLRGGRARAAALAGAPARPRPQPYILYFWGESCTICRTHQEPALSRLGDVRVEKVDAIQERELARRYRVYTLPTTVVIGADGRAVEVNYGYAPARRLRDQLALAGQAVQVGAAG